MHQIFAFLFSIDKSDYNFDPVENIDIDSIVNLWCKRQAVQSALTELKKDVLTKEEWSNAVSVSGNFRRQWDELSEEDKQAFIKQYKNELMFDGVASEVKSYWHSMYSDDFCEENNWYTEEFVLFNNGNHTYLSADETYLSADEEEKYLSYYSAYTYGTPEEKWKRALHYCYKLAFYDLDPNSYIEPDPNNQPLIDVSSIPFDQFDQFFDQKIYELIKGHFDKFLNSIDPNKVDKDENPKAYKDYLSGLRMKQLIQFNEKWENSTYKPFSQHIDNPYVNYRCYDLRNYDQYEEGSILAILFVDIHT